VAVVQYTVTHKQYTEQHKLTTNAQLHLPAHAFDKKQKMWHYFYLLSIFFGVSTFHSSPLLLAFLKVLSVAISRNF